jgi:preprotein translocase subunit SecB
MTDEPQQQAVPQLQVHAQYIKDLSFEVPGAPGIFSELAGSPPEISVRVNINVNPLDQGRFEVVLQLAVEAKLRDKTAFIVDLAYCGVFGLHVPEEHLQPMLLIECPRLLFPFARNIISDVTRDGGFPPMLLQPIDFVLLFRNRMEQLAREQGPVGTA